MPEYKNIPVDEETRDMLIVLCEVNNRKQGAQVKELVKAEFLRLKALKLLPEGGEKKSMRDLPTGE